MRFDVPMDISVTMQGLEGKDLENRFNMVHQKEGQTTYVLNDYAIDVPFLVVLGEVLEKCGYDRGRVPSLRLM